MTTKTFKLPVIGKLYKVINVSQVWPSFNEKPSKFVAHYVIPGTIIMFLSIEQKESNSVPSSGMYNLCNYIGVEGKQYQFRFHQFDIIDFYIEPISVGPT